MIKVDKQKLLSFPDLSSDIKVWGNNNQPCIKGAFYIAAGLCEEDGDIVNRFWYENNQGDNNSSTLNVSPSLNQLLDKFEKELYDYQGYWKSDSFLFTNKRRELLERFTAELENIKEVELV